MTAKVFCMPRITVACCSTAATMIRLATTASGDSEAQPVPHVSKESSSLTCATARELRSYETMTVQSVHTLEVSSCRAMLKARN
jgi:hypothetical protein